MGGDELVEVAGIDKAAAEEAATIAAAENPERTDKDIQEAYAAMEGGLQQPSLPRWM